jgi:hypothetical protein
MSKNETKRNLILQENELTKIIEEMRKVIDNFENLSYEEKNNRFLKLVALHEKACLKMRKFPSYLGNPNAMKEVQEIIDEVMNVEIGYTEQGWFCVRMPFLLPKKESGSSEYVKNMLYSPLSKFFKSKVRDVPKQAVLVYRHVYEESHPEKQMRDHDNIEINQVSDCIVLWAMEDDSPKYCEHFYMSARGDKSRTEVYVIPREEFGEFVKIRDNMPKEGVKLYDFRH